MKVCPVNGRTRMCALDLRAQQDCVARKRTSDFRLRSEKNTFGELIRSLLVNQPAGEPGDHCQRVNREQRDDTPPNLRVLGH